MTTTKPDPNPIDEDASARAVADMVAGTERTSGLVLIGIMAIAIGLPLLIGIARGHPLLGVANAILLGLIGWGAALILQALILTPVSIVRYDCAAKRLGARVEAVAEPAAIHKSWAEGTPGAITVGRDGRVWLADRSTAYRAITLERADIRRAEAITHYEVQQPRRPRAALGIGVPIGGGLIATIAAGPRSKAPRLRTSDALAMTYVAPDDATVRTTTIPFGADLGGARLMAAIFDWKPE